MEHNKGKIIAVLTSMLMIPCPPSKARRDSDQSHAKLEGTFPAVQGACVRRSKLDLLIKILFWFHEPSKNAFFKKKKKKIQTIFRQRRCRTWPPSAVSRPATK